MQGTSLAVQWLRLHACPAGGMGSIPGWGIRSHMLQSMAKTLKKKKISYQEEKKRNKKNNKKCNALKCSLEGPAEMTSFIQETSPYIVPAPGQDWEVRW